MTGLEKARKKYEEIPIPEELSIRIQKELGQWETPEDKRVKGRWRLHFRQTAAAAAALVLLFTAALNTSTAFAEGAARLPVIGAAARVLTFRSYESSEKDLHIQVEIPSVELISEDFKGLEASVNEEIYRLCESYAAEAKKRAEEYRQAFLDTGGTEEEWEVHKVEIRVWYEVKSQSDRYLSLAVMGTESWTSAYRETKYYNFDLEKGNLVSLEELLGEDYSQTVQESIRRQIPEREQETGLTFWEELPLIGEDTGFYINEAGNPVVVLDPYEIAPGAAGTQEFEIKM